MRQRIMGVTLYFCYPNETVTAFWYHYSNLDHLQTDISEVTLLYGHQYNENAGLDPETVATVYDYDP